MNKTGGGVPTTKVLNKLELRALALLGPTFVDGLGTSEVGVSEIVFIAWKYAAFLFVFYTEICTFVHFRLKLINLRIKLKFLPLLYQLQVP